jgi:hypothetical protein
MNRKVLTGIAAGLLTAALLATVAIGGYRAGERSDRADRTVTVIDQTSSDGRTVVVPDGHWDDDWGHPGFGFFLFPLIVIGVVLLLVSRPRRYGYYRHGGDGPPWRHGDDADLRDWHRREHGGDMAPAGSGPPLSPTDSTS